MKCPVCRNKLLGKGFTVSSNSTTNEFYCEHCECDYELRAKDNEFTGWWKVTKLPVLPDLSDAEYKLYEIEGTCTGDVVNEYPLGQFVIQRERFSDMSSSYSSGVDYVLVIAREDEFDEDGEPTFDTDERTLCYQGDHGPGHHLKAARNVKLWRDILKL